MSILEAEIKDTVTMSDGVAYTVTGKINYDGKTYFCLADAEKGDVLFGFEREGDFIELRDESLIQKLLPKFFEETKKHIDDFKNLELPSDEEV